jgi:hypothetical protein
MPVVERSPGGTSLIDVLDRVLDKGIVIDAWVRVSLVGIDLVTVEARIVVASIDTFLRYSEVVHRTPFASTPLLQDDLAEGEDEDQGGDGAAGVLARLRPGDPPRRPRGPLSHGPGLNVSGD